MQIVGLVISWAVAIGIIGIGIGYAAKSGMKRDGLWIASATRKRGGHFATFCQCPLYPPKADIATRPLSSTALSIGQEFGASCCRIFLAKRPNVLEASF